MFDGTILNAFTPVAAQAADADGIIIDTAGYRECTFAVTFGAEAFTMNGSNYVDVIAQDGAQSDLSDAAVVPAARQIGTWETPALGIFKRLDASGDAPAVYKFGIALVKRYLRFRLDFTGIVTGGIPVSAIAILSGARRQPVGETQTP